MNCGSCLVKCSLNSARNPATTKSSKFWEKHWEISSRWDRLPCFNYYNVCLMYERSQVYEGIRKISHWAIQFKDNWLWMIPVNARRRRIKRVICLFAHFLFDGLSCSFPFAVTSLGMIALSVVQLFAPSPIHNAILVINTAHYDARYNKGHRPTNGHIWR